MKALLAVVVMSCLAACGEQVSVSVECVSTAGPAVACDLLQKVGKSEVEVCWDFQVECGNGAIVKAPRTCHRLSGGAAAKVTIPGDRLEGIERCSGDTAPKATLSNLTIDGVPQS
jgi:hypothetical protein